MFSNNYILYYFGKLRRKIFFCFQTLISQNPVYRSEPQTYNQYEDEHRLKPVNPLQSRPALLANLVAQSPQPEVENPFHSSDKAAYSLRFRLGNISSSAAILGDFAQFWLLFKGFNNRAAVADRSRALQIRCFRPILKVPSSNPASAGIERRRIFGA